MEGLYVAHIFVGMPRRMMLFGRDRLHSCLTISSSWAAEAAVAIAMIALMWLSFSTPVGPGCSSAGSPWRWWWWSFMSLSSTRRWCRPLGRQTLGVFVLGPAIFPWYSRVVGPPVFFSGSRSWHFLVFPEVEIKEWIVLGQCCLRTMLS